MNMTKMNRFSLSCIVLALAFGGLTTIANGQSSHFSPKNLGMGGGGTAYVDGYHANFVNPANLMLSLDKPNTMVGLFGGLSTDIGGPLVNIGVYNKYFTQGETVSGALADEALGQWFGSDPQEMKKLAFQSDIIPFGIAKKQDNWALGLAARSRVFMTTSVSKGLAQFGLLGLDTEVFDEGQPINFALDAVSFYELSAGLSLKLIDLGPLRLHAGAAPKLLLGTSASSVNFNSVLTLHTDEFDQIEAIQHEFAYRMETTGQVSQQLLQYYNDKQQSGTAPSMGDYINPAVEDYYSVSGTGLGLDLGATLEMDIALPIVGILFPGKKTLRVGASITDLGGFAFTDDIARFSAEDDFYWEGFDFDAERIDEDFNGDRQQYIDHVLQDSIAKEIYGSYAPEEVNELHRSLPTKLNLGGQLQMGKLSVAADISQGFNDVGTNSTRPALSAGAEYDLFGFIPLRAGMRTGGYTSTSYSVGTGLEFRYLEFSVSASNVVNSSKYGAGAGFAWSGLVVRF
jgi:hypothetical protein